MPHRTTSIAALNLLTDYPKFRVPDQIDRLPGITETLSYMAGDLDAIYLSEVEGDNPENNHALQIAHALGWAGCKWVPYARPKEGMALLTPERQPVVAYTLDPRHDQRKALATNLGETLFIGTHWSWQPHHPLWRRAQSQAVVALGEVADRVIIAGDFNTRPSAGARRRLEKAGYINVTKDECSTFPSEVYPCETIDPWKRRFVPEDGFEIDGIYAKGALEVVSAYTFTADSDHYGVRATLTDREVDL